jgi:competence ComEA-like helix-hairpin-helix protein
MINRLLREVYLLSRGEQRALVLVSFLLILSVGIRLLVQILPEREPAGMEEFVKESQTLFASIALADSLQKQRSDSVKKIRKSGSFTSTSYSYPSSAKKSKQAININRADSAHLLPLPGIGPVFAGRIVKYRELLGGYVRIDQLCEVYGFPEKTLELIRGRIVLDSSAIRKILLDSASFRDLLRHPYLELEEVKSLVNYRDFKQNISTLLELRQNQVLPDSTLERIGPYLDLKCE